MADIVSPAVRSRMMAGIRAKNTKPEMIVRRGLHAMGFRFRLHDRKLPGKPDIVFAKYRAAILVNGCFWHGHECELFKWPKSREDFWRDKIGRNRANDAKNAATLSAQGWRQLTIWECAIKRRDTTAVEALFAQCRDWLIDGGGNLAIGTT
jgi:DNA mismatch endonuclease, patch repair protein